MCDGDTDSNLQSVEVPCEIIILQNGVSTVPEDMKVREIEILFHSADTSMRKLQIRERGKGKALNIGIQHAKHEFICVLDADCVLDEYAINIAMLHFEDVKVSAVGGKLKAMSEKKNLLTFCQRVEYMKTFNIWRPLLDVLNANCLISGAFGIFRKSHILSVNGYDDDTVGEDMELVLSVQQLFRPYGKSVYYEENSICYTKVPTTMRRLLHQRDRWQRGLLDCILKHNYLILNPLYGFLGLVAMPFQVMQLMSPIFVLIHAANLICAALHIEGWFAVYGPVKYWTGVMSVEIPQMWELYFLYLGFELSVTCIAEYAEHDKWWMLVTKLPEAVAATALGIMLSVLLSVARLWGMISFPWRRLVW